MARLIISDASPIIGLARVNHLDWLRMLFGEIRITTEVWNDLLGHGCADEGHIVKANNAGWLILVENTPVGPEIPILSPGEESCIRVALAQTTPTLLLIDERLARREAEKRGLRVAGTAAIIGQLKKRCLIPSSRQVFEELLRARFRLSKQLIRQVLAEVDELV